MQESEAKLIKNWSMKIQTDVYLPFQNLQEFIWNIFLIFTTKIKLWMYKWTYFDVDFQFNVKSLSYMVDSSLVEVNTKFSPLLTSDIFHFFDVAK